MGDSDHARRRLQLVVFLIEEQRHALALHTVERVVQMVAVSPLPEAPPIALGVIDVHGAILPVFDLRVRFAFPRREYGVGAHLLLVRTAQRRMALATDQVVGVTEVEGDGVMPPDAAAVGPRGLAGIVALPDGLVFIHDLDRFLSLDEQQRVTRALETTTG